MQQNLIDPDDVARLIAGEEAAIKKVYEAYSEQLYRLAFKFLKDRAWSEEIVQETFLKLWLNREALVVSDNLWPFLYVVSKRLCLNKLRDIRKSNLMLEQLKDNIELAANATEEMLESREIEQITDRIIARLPKQQQLAFKLSREEGLSHKEIAERLGISPNTVKNHIIAALKTLRLSLRRSDYLYILGSVLLENFF